VFAVSDLAHEERDAPETVVRHRSRFADTIHQPDDKTRQSSLFEYEADTPQDIIERVQHRALEIVDSTEVGVDV
jgi:hypothetical protein